MSKVFFDLEKFAREEISDKADRDMLKLCIGFFKSRKRSLDLSELEKRDIEELFWGRLLCFNPMLTYESYVEAQALFERFLKYNKSSLECRMQNEGVERFFILKNEFNRFLNNPVLRKGHALLIDMDRYKKRLQKRRFASKASKPEKGIFMVIEVFNNNTVVLKKRYSGQFIKLSLNKSLADNMRPMDVLSISVRQGAFFGWELDEVRAYYPAEILEKLNRSDKKNSDG